MDWAGVIDRNREDLLRIIAALFAMAGLVEGMTVATLPRHVYGAVLKVLRPAESAVRRLIIIAARDLSVPPPAIRPGPAAPARAHRPANIVVHKVFLGLAGVPAPGPPSCKSAERTAASVPPFPLFDPRKRFDFNRRRYTRNRPRIRSLDPDWSLPVYMRRPAPPDRPEPAPGDAIGAQRLCRRLLSLKRALDDLPGQAMRLARWRARSAVCPKTRPRWPSPMRPGWPPGHRKRSIHYIDDVLRECHSLALHALEPPDTS